MRRAAHRRCLLLPMLAAATKEGELVPLGADAAVASAAELAGLVEELKRFEYRLRREIDEENEDLFLAGNEEMPNQFRELVEEYFRSLSENQ